MVCSFQVFEQELEGGDAKKIVASDKTNEEFNQIDLSTIRRCLEKFDVMESNKPQIMYHIVI